MGKVVSKTSYQDKFAVAVYKDKRRWVAHNLSLDIVATATRKSDALDELRKLTISQVDFAISHNMPESINHPAPNRFWQMVSEKMTASLVGKLFSHSEARKKVQRMISDSPIYDLTRFSHTRLA